MKNILIIMFSIFCTKMNAQTDLGKWKKAVIHIECTGAASTEKWHQEINELWDKIDSGTISSDEYHKIMVERSSRDVRYHGTAIYFIDKAGEKYLITARHVLFDQKTAIKDSSKQNDLIFNIIFRVASLDEYIMGTRVKPQYLMNLQAGPTGSRPYTFSSSEVDLGIIHLRSQFDKFAEELDSLGYVPITEDDIAFGPTEEGIDILSIGYPEAISILGSQQLHPAIANWQSSDISLPVSSFGKVSMLHNKLYFFWSDISLYPGNSGGPVIQNNKLVGIVSGQATISVDNSTLRTRVPFAKIIKAQYIFDLLKVQQKKQY